MIPLESASRFDFDFPAHEAAIDCEPFGFTHHLHDNALFDISNLELLARTYASDDYFVAAGATAAGTAFYSVEHSTLEPTEALRKLECSSQRVLLKRPEKYDPRFRDLLNSLIDQLFAGRGGPPPFARLQSSILVSSSQTITPFHFDPEVSFFFQIQGPKRYHLYSPAALCEPELEHFCKRGVVDIGQVALAGRDPKLEYLFELAAGKGMYQPRNSPHWVETGAALSISYVVSYETPAMRALDRVRSFNYYLRRTGVGPGLPGRNATLDALKSTVMTVATPARNRSRAILDAMRLRYSRGAKRST